MKHNNPVYYEVYAMGKFANLGKTVYTNWKSYFFKLDDIRFDENGRRRQGITFHYGLDFGLACQ